MYLFYLDSRCLFCIAFTTSSHQMFRIEIYLFCSYTRCLFVFHLLHHHTRCFLLQCIYSIFTPDVLLPFIYFIFTPNIFSLKFYYSPFPPDILFYLLPLHSRCHIFKIYSLNFYTICLIAFRLLHLPTRFILWKTCIFIPDALFHLHACFLLFKIYLMYLMSCLIAFTAFSYEM